MPDLIVVVEPNYGERILETCRIAPVWIIDTPVNRAACEKLWSSAPTPDHRTEGAVTTYATVDPGSRAEALLTVLPQLETHHGVVDGNYLVFPTGFVLEVVGVQGGEDVTDSLREYGFTSFAETASGFRAYKKHSLRD